MRTRLLVVLVVAVGAGAAAFGWLNAGRGSSPVAFSTVPVADLVGTGLSFSTPTGPTPSATAGRAAAAAASKAYGARVLEIHYARCADSERVPHLNEDCWAVSLDPSNQRAAYSLVLVDPANDHVIEGTAIG